MKKKSRVGSSTYRFMYFYEETVLIKHIDDGKDKNETTVEVKASTKISSTVKVRRKGRK